MKILIVNTQDFGGAAKACIRLHKGLLEENLDSKLLLKYKSGKIPNSFSFESLSSSTKTGTLLDRIKKRIKKDFMTLIKTYWGKEVQQQKFLHKRNPQLELFTFPYSSFDITCTKEYQQADIINLHWVANFLDWSTFFQKNTKPIVWTLHDQNPFLGGEHYSERFCGIDENGVAIPRVYEDFEKEKNEVLTFFKKEKLKGISNLHIVSPSKWLLEESKKSETFHSYSHFHIPYGLDIEVFKPYNKDFCREVLRLPKNKIVLLFVADIVSSNRKGYIYLQKAIEELNSKYQDEVVLCAIGADSRSDNQNENVFTLGELVDERMMAMAYSAADVFIIPSIEDNLPNTMIESVCCGTPVLGFNVGGIPDIVEDGKNGYLASKISVTELKNIIEKFLDNPSLFNRENISKEARNKYALSVQAQHYFALYKQILNK